MSDDGDSKIAVNDNRDEEKKKKKVFIPLKIYASRALSAWGDRMWQYGAGLFLTRYKERERIMHACGA